MWNFNFPRQSIWAQPTAKVWTVLSHILNFKLGMENMHHHWPSDCTFNLNSSINKCCWQKTQPHYQKNYKGFTTMFVCTPFVWWTILCSVTQTADIKVQGIPCFFRSDSPWQAVYALWFCIVWLSHIVFKD